MARKVVGARSSLVKSMELRDGREVKDSSSERQDGEVHQFDGTPATVSCGMKSAINMGNYQSLHLSVGISYPCDPKKISTTFDAVSKFVAKKLDEMVQTHTVSPAGAVEDVDEVEI